jgi:hypothetical protein
MINEEPKKRHSVKALFKSAIFWAKLQQKKEKVSLPTVATYVHQVNIMKLFLNVQTVNDISDTRT